ncbi:sensor histidine kinase [Chitinophaga qingshengii]|uniref:histidine kinase n=1 Tax=Chitinophaga qingshengii TaxID=1569794 RepID=A0ABR7TPC3_9BACT|nr:PAS domain-containing sensor histidine kinase [Chitinophaga qingshengii]MBC9932331.1 PAS domain S-box protein [Chitinophaga qingshengii]
MTTTSTAHVPGFELLFNHATQGILLVDGAGLIRAANPCILEWSGHTPEEVEGQPLSSLLAGDIRSWLRCKNGQAIPVNMTCTSYLQADQHYQVCFINDLSAQQQTADALKRTQDAQQLEAHIMAGKETAYRRVSNFLNSIWTNLDAILIVTEPMGHIRFFNPAAVRMLGYPSREITDTGSLIQFHDFQELERRAAKLSEELQQTVEPGFDTLTIKARLNLPNEYEWAYIRKDGSRFPVALTVSAIRDESQHITGYIAIGLDISARRKSEAELRQALDKEKELNVLKSRFVSIASHEFRTPLSTVLSSTYLLEKYTNTEDQPKRLAHIRKISSAVHLLTDILNDFLSLGKIEEGKIVVRPALTDIRNHVEKILAEAEGLKRGRQQVVYQHEGETESTLDGNLLRHVLTNLVSNALKFSPEEGTVHVHTHATPYRLLLSVKDAGIGIKPEDQQHLFERFFRGSNVENIQGTGLGLHIVAKYTELMKGQVTCHSEPDKGTEFIVHIPTPKT